MKGYLIFVCTLSVLPLTYSVTDLTQRLQTILNRADIICPLLCYFMSRLQIGFCVCYAELSYQYTRSLNLTYDKNTRTSELSEGQWGTFWTKYRVDYTGSQGKLIELPTNLCEFQKVVEIDFSYNNISNIDKIKCLKNLVILILKWNSIYNLKKETFIELKYIQKIDLSYNRLRYIEPGFLYNMEGRLSFVNFSHNLLTTADVTNIAWSKQENFCEVDFSHNQISRIVNELHWHCKGSDDFGRGGMVDFSYNKFTQFMNFADIGFSNIFHLGKLMSYGFDFRHNDWFCDCKFYPFALRAVAVAQKIYREYFKVRCHSPAELKDVYLLDLIDSNNLQRLICNLSMVERCPPRCRCFYQPDRWRTIINCSNTGRTGLPSALPLYKNLNVDLSNNAITNLSSVLIPGSNNYFVYVSKLDLSRNKIQELPKEMFSLLRSAYFVNFTGNEISGIPRSLQILNPCRITMGNIRMKCHCGDLWLKDWLKSRQECIVNTVIYCQTFEGYVDILYLTDDELGCKKVDEYILWIKVSLGTVCIITFVCAFIIFKFRYETFILGRKLFKHIKPVRISSHQYDYEVYISCNEEDNGLRHWLLSFLVPYLDRKGYRIYLPFRDSEIGRPREEEIIEVTPLCLNYIIFLSENYDGPSEMWIQKEWKYCWNNYRTDINHEIIVINYDMLKIRDVVQRYIRAFFGLGLSIDFSNRLKSFEDDLSSLLQKTVQTVKGNESQNDLNISVSNISVVYTSKNIDTNSMDCNNSRINFEMM